MNRLFFGDNLEILKRLYEQNRTGFIDLIYIDPPFNSKRNYNVLFESVDLDTTKAQKEAFADTWTNVQYVDTLDDIKTHSLDLYNFLQSLENIRVSKSAVSYLTTMAVRIWYMHKLLKDTGSFYLHCDPNMSHYLKIVCDIIFGDKHFKNEIIWQRTNAHNMKAGYFGRVHDVILFYTKSSEYTWIEQHTEYSPEQMSRFKADPDGRLYKAENLTFSSPNPKRQFEWRGVKPPANRSWGASLEQLEEWWNEGRILKKLDGSPRMDGLKVYLDTLPGKALNDVWTDIPRVGNTSSESLGYPTQKPKALLDRIIRASSKPGNIVADFFCGCGTTIAVAEELKRQWLGVDISHLAVNLISKRLVDTYGKEIKSTFEIDGMPKDLDSARNLALETKGRFKFQDWIIEVMLHGVVNEKKSADGGWDGYISFEYTEGGDAIKVVRDTVLIEVKSGNVNVKNVREFIQVVKKMKAGIGVFVCFADQITKPMVLEAKQAGYFRDDIMGHSYDRIQIISVDDLLDGVTVKMPRTTVGTFKSAKRLKATGGNQTTLGLD